jgi:hypothetical protein
MSSKAKVGSWIGKGAANAKGDANESDSDAESSAASSVSDVEDTPVKKTAAVHDDDDDEDEDEVPTPEVAERELNIDWEVVLPKVRPSLLDRSRKRREQFAARFLYVTDEGEWSFVVAMSAGHQ